MEFRAWKMCPVLTKDGSFYWLACSLVVNGHLWENLQPSGLITSETAADKLGWSR